MTLQAMMALYATALRPLAGSQLARRLPCLAHLLFDKVWHSASGPILVHRSRYLYLTCHRQKEPQCRLDGYTFSLATATAERMSKVFMG
jgi:hypothetical protein